MCQVEVRPCLGQDGMLLGANGWAGATRVKPKHVRLAHIGMRDSLSFPLIRLGLILRCASPLPAYRSPGTGPAVLLAPILPCNHPARPKLGYVRRHEASSVACQEAAPDLLSSSGQTCMSGTGSSQAQGSGAVPTRGKTARQLGGFRWTPFPVTRLPCWNRRHTIPYT